MPAREMGRILGVALGLWTMLAASLLAAPVVVAQEAKLPLPRFASLRSDEVNLRTGPGLQYPIEWVLKRQYMPVEIVAEFDHWRQVRDWFGDQGWVEERMVVGTRSVVVQGGIRVLHSQPDAAAAIVARAEPGVVARLVACRGGWCQVDARDITGWLPRGEIWGVLPEEGTP